MTKIKFESSDTGANHNQYLLTILICIGLTAAIFVAYAPVRHNGFIEFYDDNTYVTKNPNVTGGLTADSVVWAFTSPHEVNWHPITWLSHILDCELYGLNPLGHHLTSLLIHIANTLLLFFILRKMTGSVWPGAFVAAVFALHPLQVDSVAWVAERKTVLSGLFWLLTIAAYLRYTAKPIALRYILLIVIYALCIMTKPVVVTLPLVLLLLDFWPLGRFQKSQLDRQASGGSSILKPVIEKIPLFILSTILCVITFIMQKRGGAVIAIEEIPLDYRIANSFVSYFKYIEKTVWPSHLAAFYPSNPQDLSMVIVATCVVILISLTAFCVYAGLRRKYLAVGWLWFVGTLVPVIGLVQAGGQSMANRYMYLPIIGLLIIIGYGINDITARWKHRGKILALSAAALIVCAIAITRTEVGYWRDSVTLFDRTLKVTENNSLAELCYGCALAEAGNADEGLLHLKNAIRISPNFFEARNKLGILCMRMGKFNEAIECFSKLLPLNKNLDELHYNLAMALSGQKKYDEAIKHFNAVLALNPDYYDTHEQILACLLASGRTNEAIAQLNESLTKNADKANIYSNLGTAYVLQGKTDMAIESWTKAVQLKPNSFDNLNNLAWLLATKFGRSAGDANKAIEFARRACELTGYKKPESLDTLAAAYAATGKFPDAVATAEKALNAAKAAGQNKLAREIQNRIELYRANKPYREK